MAEVVLSEAEREAIEVLAAHAPEPGTECPTCRQRIPHPPKPTSPPSKKMGYWLPADEKPAHDDVLEQSARHLGVYEQPYWEFKTVTLGLGLVLQDESLRGFGQRGPA